MHEVSENLVVLVLVISVVVLVACKKSNFSNKVFSLFLATV